MTELNIDSRETLYVARQPILDGQGRVFGYELLYRDVPGETGAGDDLAGARVLTDAVVNLGLETVTGGKPAFLNLSRPLLLRLPSLLPPAVAVFELRSDVAVDPEIADTCAALHASGYALGLDDFELESGAAALLPLVKYVKVDTSRGTPESRVAIARDLKSSRVKLVAGNVATREEFDRLRDAGYHLFQGRYFSTPAVCSAVALPGRQLAYLQLLGALNKEDVTLNEVENLVKHDVSLSYRVLRCINSAAWGIRREVQSIRQALLLLGLAPIRSWASVWCVAGLNTGGASEHVTTVLIRGRCCELLAEKSSHPEASSEMFLVGLCSMLDLMLGKPMSEAIAELPLSETARNALLGDANDRRTLLDGVVAYEGADWDSAIAAVERIGLTGADLAEAYTDSLRWARELSVS